MNQEPGDQSQVGAWILALEGECACVQACVCARPVSMCVPPRVSLRVRTPCLHVCASLCVPACAGRLVCRVTGQPQDVLCGDRALTEVSGR